MKIGPYGIAIKREEDLTREGLVRRANLYYHVFAYGSAMRLYKKLIFQDYPIEPYYQDYVNFLYDRTGDPTLPEMLFRLGDCYARMNKWKEGIAAFKAFGELFPNHPLAPLALKRLQELELRRL